MDIQYNYVFRDKHLFTLEHHTFFVGIFEDSNK